MIIITIIIILPLTRRVLQPNLQQAAKRPNMSVWQQVTYFSRLLSRLKVHWTKRHGSYYVTLAGRSRRPLAMTERWSFFSNVFLLSCSALTRSCCTTVFLLSTGRIRNHSSFISLYLIYWPTLGTEYQGLIIIIITIRSQSVNEAH